MLSTSHLYNARRELIESKAKHFTMQRYCNWRATKDDNYITTKEEVLTLLHGNVLWAELNGYDLSESDLSSMQSEYETVKKIYDDVNKYYNKALEEIDELIKKIEQLIDITR